jgi:hypothetical protein
VCDGFQLFIVIFYNVLRFIFPYTGALRWYYETVCLISQGTIQLVFLALGIESTVTAMR